MVEFKVGEHEYRSEKIDVFKQNNIVRRLTPFLTSFASVFDKIKADPMAALEPLGKAFASMSDQDMEYVLTTCLAACMRKQGDTWIRVYLPNGGLNCEDIDLLQMHMIVFNVLKDNLSGFFAGLVHEGFVPPALMSN